MRRRKGLGGKAGTVQLEMEQRREGIEFKERGIR